MKHKCHFGFDKILARFVVKLLSVAKAYCPLTMSSLDSDTKRKLVIQTMIRGAKYNGHSVRSLAFVLLFAATWPLLFGLPVLAASTPKEPIIAFAARLVGDQQRARMIVDFNRETVYDIYLLNDPKRLVIDLPETLFSLDSDASKLPKTLASSVRFGTIARGQSRIVLELNEPVTIENHRLKVLDGGNRHRLIVDMVKAPVEKFLKSVRLEEVDKKTEKNTPASPQQFKIVIDPGHGGIDGGATGGRKVREKNVTLQFALKLRKALEQNPSFNVVLTRDNDSFIGLRDRVAIARKNRADLMISIHADSLRQKDIRGATVYTLSKEGSDELSRVLAKKQNRADLIAGLSIPTTAPNVADILIDLTRRETEGFSVRFAKQMVQHLSKNMKLIHNPHRSADFFVLKAPEIPSILLELGYLSNREDERLMQSPKWQERAAASVTDAIIAFFGPRLAKQ